MQKMNLTKISIERPTLVVVVFSLLIFLGALSYTFLNYELVPKFTPPVITVTTVYPGASPDQVESAISKPIEDALASIENIDELKSISQENFSLVRLELKTGSDVHISLQEAERKLAMILPDLPQDARQPLLSRFDFDDLPVMRMGVSSSLKDEEFYALLKNNVVPEISQIEGVAQVRILGGREKEVHVNLLVHKMHSLKISALQVIKAIRMANLDIPAGSLQDDEQNLFVRLSGKFTSLDELENVSVAERMGRHIRLSDIAIVEEATKDISVISRINDEQDVGLDIKKQGDANAVEMSALVRQKINYFEHKYQNENLKFQIVQDTSEFTLAAANAVIEDLGLAVLLVSLVMLLFLHSMRNALIVLVSIPTSIVSTFIVMYLLGYSLNLLSLLALSLAIGILVDDSIVVIENIYRHIEMGKSKVNAAYEGRMEIGFTAISITLIDVVVFLPIVFATGMVADLLRQFSVVIITSTLMSLFVSFTMVPWLTSRFGKLSRVTGKSQLTRFVLNFEKSIDALIRKILIALEWSFGHKRFTFLLAFLLLLASISLILFGFIGLEFTKSGDRGEFLVELELPKGTSLSKTNDISRQVEKMIQSHPDVVSVYSTVGITSSGRIEFNTSNLAELTVTLIDKTKRSYSGSAFARTVKLELEKRIPGLRIRPIDINILGLRDDDAVQVTLMGNNPALLDSISDSVVQLLDQIPGAVEIQKSTGTSSREMMVKVDQNKIEKFGLNAARVGTEMRTSFTGNTDAKYQSDQNEYDINVRLASFSRSNENDLKSLSFLNDKGHLIKLNQFAAFEEALSPAALERTNRSSSVTIKSQVIGKPAGTIGNSLAQSLKKSELPEEISYLFGGQTKRTREGLRTMGIAFGISILLVYFILVALYDSYYYPLVVLFSIPLAIIGALLALALAKQALSIFSIMGLIILVGLVGKNAILVVDFTNNLRLKGIELKAALIEATKLRFRPILMTNITMVIGLLPIALASGAGSEWKNGLAWALIGGLSSSMFLTLIIVPIVYFSFEKVIDKAGVKRIKKMKVGN